MSEALLPQLTPVLGPGVGEVLAAMGRTEDLAFSPSSRRLALAAFNVGAIVVLEVEIDSSGPVPAVRVEAARSLTHPELHGPHGLDWLDDDTLVVASRHGAVSVFAIPPAEAGDALIRIGPPEGRGLHGLADPGSVVVAGRGTSVEVLVANNAGERISRHELRRAGDAVEVGGDAVLIDRWLQIPDGVTVSADDRWVAVSNHIHHLVMVHGRTPGGEATPDPVAILRGPLYPHGLRFTRDAEHLIVADAGAPYLRVYARPGDAWAGVRHPSASLRVMGEAVFQAGRRNPQEGGPKGVALDGGDRVLATTSECQPLALYDLDALLATPSDDGASIEVSFELDLLTQTLDTAAGTGSVIADTAARAHQAAMEAAAARDEASIARRHAEATEARAEAAEAEVRAIEATKTFRATARLRRTYAAARERLRPS